jgi:hypothetical protein
MIFIIRNGFVLLTFCAVAVFSTQLVAAQRNADASSKSTGKMQPQASFSIVGKWAYNSSQFEIVTEFRSDGTFHEADAGPGGIQIVDGHYRVDGQILLMQANGTQMQASYVFRNADTAVITYPNGNVAEFKRIVEAKPQKQTPKNPLDVKKEVKVMDSNDSQVPAGDKNLTAKPQRSLLMRRVAEPNENAFTVLVPKGWLISGGVFNVTAQQTGGPVNSLAPKCDFSVKIDAAGTVMVRWIPTWYYADLRSTSMAGYFQSGQFYQGMPVRNIVNPDEFLTQLMGTERKGAQNVSVIGTDTMNEVTEAFGKKYAAVNQSLVQMGLAPMKFNSLAIFVEYVESGVRYREALFTTISDSRGGAFMWSNENTVMFRAPAESFDKWKPLLDMIRESFQFNPKWLESVRRNSDDRAKSAVETQRYINNVCNEMAANRAKTNEEINHENWLLLTGQDEYKNPYTGEVERGTSQYDHRWENNQGDVLYTNENGFDPNSVEEYNSREWKKSEVWDRK